MKFVFLFRIYCVVTNDSIIKSIYLIMKGNFSDLMDFSPVQDAVDSSSIFYWTHL